MQDSRDNRIHVDEDGNRRLTDENGILLSDEFGDPIAPSQSERTSKDGEFTTYDDSQGHCSLCGSISCNGGCFK